MPWRVGEHLHLDVAAVLDVLLDQHACRRRTPTPPRAARRRPRRRARSAPRTIRMPLPPPPAAALTRTGKSKVVGASVAVVRRHDRDARPRPRSRGPRPCGPSAPSPRRTGRPATSPASSTRPGERGALGEEAVAGVDRVGARRRAPRRRPRRCRGSSTRPRDGRRRPRARAARRGRRRCRPRRCAMPSRAAGADHPQRDLAAVGDQDGRRTTSVIGPLTSGRRRSDGAGIGACGGDGQAHAEHAAGVGGSMMPSSQSRAVE